MAKVWTGDDAWSGACAVGRKIFFSPQNAPTALQLLEKDKEPMLQAGFAGAGGATASASGTTAVPGGAEPGEPKECAVCLEERQEWACVPCGHLCLCGDCVVNHRYGANGAQKECPVCRTRVQSTVRIYSV